MVIRVDACLRRRSRRSPTTSCKSAVSQSGPSITPRSSRAPSSPGEKPRRAPHSQSFGPRTRRLHRPRGAAPSSTRDADGLLHGAQLRAVPVRHRGDRARPVREHPAREGVAFGASPVGVEPAALDALLASCDRASTTGRRDYAVLAHVRLGLRPSSRTVSLEEIDRRGAQLVVRGKEDATAGFLSRTTSVRHWPTTCATGPPTTSRAVFLSARPPFEAMSRDAVVFAPALPPSVPHPGCRRRSPAPPPRHRPARQRRSFTTSENCSATTSQPPRPFTRRLTSSAFPSSCAPSPERARDDHPLTTSTAISVWVAPSATSCATTSGCSARSSPLSKTGERARSPPRTRSTGPPEPPALAKLDAASRSCAASPPTSPPSTKRPRSCPHGSARQALCGGRPISSVTKRLSPCERRGASFAQRPSLRR